MNVSQRVKAAVRVRPVRLVIIILVVMLSWEMFIRAGAGSRITPELAAAAQAADRVAVTIHFSFDAEPFHLRYVQEQGVIVSITARSITLRRVDPADLPAMARQYWIDRLDLADDVPG